MRKQSPESVWFSSVKAGHRLYVVEYKNGAVKIGCSAHVANRLRALSRQAVKRHIKIVRFHASDCVRALGYKAEQIALLSARRISVQGYGTEIFWFLPFQMAVHLINQVAKRNP